MTRDRARLWLMSTDDQGAASGYLHELAAALRQVGLTKRYGVTMTTCAVGGWVVYLVDRQYGCPPPPTVCRPRRRRCGSPSLFLWNDRG